jgi:hypothetical protein
MTKRRKKNDALETLLMMLITIIQEIIIVIARLISLIYDLITFYTSGYKIKSGNGFFKTYFDKGKYGEFSLYRKVIRIFGKQSVFTNIYLDNRNTETTEIDVLSISSKGIYVFEMKNYAGFIYGSENDQHWTQVFNKRTKHQFYNPLKQNYAHTKAIQNYLGIEKDVIVPIVVFSNRSKLSKININPNQHVFQYRNALKYVKRYEKKQVSSISVDDKEKYMIKLIDKCNMSEEVKIKHIENIKEMVLAKSNG